MKEDVKVISNSFESGDIKTAKETSVKLKYRMGVEESINARLQEL
jgi:hypothetical protein